VNKTINIKVLGLALFAVFAFSAATAASAFAVSEWLWQGAAIPNGVELATNTEGELVFGVLSASGALVNEIDCSALFEGTVSKGPVDLVLDVYDLAESLIEELEPSPGVIGKSLSCVTLVDNGACKLSSEEPSETLLWVDELRLPAPGVEELTWESLIELDGTTFLDHFHHVAFELRCVLLNSLTLLALCEGLTSGTLTNEAPGVLLTFGVTQGSEALTCTNTVEGAEQEKTSVDLSGDLTIKHVESGTLAVS
jgi:hypothetical protein